MTASIEQVLSQLQRWTSARPEEFSDAVLLERFAQRRDESAFAALVARHGAMVLRSCRRVLGNVHEAEDAFQAVFLVLARKAGTLKQPDALPGWLHGVARRVALKERSKAAVHTGRVLLPEELSDAHSDPLAQLTARELLAVLDEEVARLPGAQRSPVILCCLEGRTQEEAARILGWTPGSLKGHLERGRRRLHSRLQGRGIALPAALALLAISRGEAVSALLLQNTVKAVVGGSIGSSAAALAHGVLQAMFLPKLAAGMAVTLALALAASTTAVLVYRGPGVEVPEDKPPAVPVASKNIGAKRPIVLTDVWGDPLPPQAIARLGSLRLYHGGAVHRVILSPDGKWVVSTNHDGNRLWEAAPGREQPLREELRQAAIFATRDKLVAAANQNGDLQLWDIASNKKFGILLPAAKVGPLWKTLHLFWAGENFFSPLVLAPDGRTLALCNSGADGKPVLRFCDVLSGQVEEPIALKLGNGGIEIRMAFSADSKTLVVQCDEATVHIWDVARRTEKMVSQSIANDYGGEIALSPDGTILATAPRKGKRVRLWDTPTLQELPPLLRQPKELVRAIAFSPDLKQLAVSYSPGVGGGDAHLWDLPSRKEVRKFQGKTRILSLAFSADGKYLAAGDGGGITFWDMATGKLRHDFGHTYTIRSMCFSPDGRRIVSGAPYTDKIIRIWDPLTGKEMAQLRGHKWGIQRVAYAPDGKRIASASEDGTVRLWDAETGQEVRRLESKDGQVYGMAFAPDGKTLASGGAGCAVHFWDVATDRKLRSVAVPGGFLMNLALSPDGKWLATQDRDEKGIQLWDAAKGEQIRRLGRQETHWNNLAFSPDSRMLASGSDDGIVRIWELPSGDECHTFTVPLKPHWSSIRVASVAFSPDGRSLTVGYMDKTVRVWELSSGGERLRFQGHRSGIASLAYSPDGTLLASGGNEDLILMVWDVTGQRTTHPPRKDHLRPEESHALWNDLADVDASKAYRAMQTLFAAGERAVSLLKHRLHPAAALDARRLDRLIADLDSDRFEVRETAEKELRKMGEDAEPALRKILAAEPSAEQRRRVKQLLQEIDDAGSSERLRGVRAVEVLERLGTPDARQVLRMLAEGDRNARLTHEAKAALERLQRKKSADKAEPRP